MMQHPLLSRLQLGLRRKTPTTLQTEAAECGLACMVMLLGHHGTVTDLATLRQRHGATPQGMTLTQLARVADAEKLATRAVRLELNELDELRLPCILHWDMSHFVVLMRVHGDRVVVLDPASGEREITRRDLSRYFTGVALEVWPQSDFVARQEGQRISLARLLGSVSGLWPALWRVLAISLLLELLGLVSPVFMQWVMDHVIVARDAHLLTVLGSGFLMLLLVQQLFTVLRSWLMLRISTQLRVQWRSNVFSHLLRLPLDFFARRHLGDLMSRFGSVERIQGALTSVFVESVLDGLMVLLALVVMMLYSPLLTGISVVSVLLYLAVRVAWYGPLRRASAERLVREANESTHFLESLRGMRAIRLFARGTERLGAWQTLMVADVNAELRIQKLEIFYRLVRGTLTGVFAIVLLWVGANQVLDGQLTAGMLLAFLAYRGQFDTRVTELVDKWIELRMLGLDAQRLADIVLTDPEPERPGELRLDGRQPPDIQLQGLRFSYAPGAPPVLDGLNLHIPAGQSIAIAGASGCGKSTLVNLLLGVHTPQSGTITAGGRRIDELGWRQWRSAVGTVMQDDVLFAGTLADNISFFDPAPHTEWIIECARMAAIDDDIQRLPMGYQTLVGDMGAALSGGQKQRILLARALYRRPRVLILDEATSHLDTHREKEVNRALAAMKVTRIVIAHRLQTLETVDRVVELADGRIAHDESPQQHVRRVLKEQR